jgi:adenosylhomocysteine nucleosidase
VSRAALVAVLVAGCAAAPPFGGAGQAATVVLISANAEWTPVVAQFPAVVRHDSPFGEWFIAPLHGRDVVFMHGGFGKVSAAASTQWAIDRWRPRLLVNLGTCGGFGGDVAVGDIVLVTRTVIYDLLEQQGDAAETIAGYSTALDTSAWPARLASRVRKAPIVSGDRDLVPAELPALHAKYGASVGDWESGAIAWVAEHNHTRVIILRGVTDLVDAGGDATYGDIGAWQREAATMMKTLVTLLDDALPAL